MFGEAVAYLAALIEYAKEIRHGAYEGPTVPRIRDYPMSDIVRSMLLPALLVLSGQSGPGRWVGRIRED